MKYYDCVIDLTLKEPIDVGGCKPIQYIRVPTIWITGEQLVLVVNAYKESGRYAKIEVKELREKKQWW